MILTYGNDLVGYGGDLVDYGLKPRTVRFKFSNDSYYPTSETWKTGAVWTRVSSNPNVWDYHRDAAATQNSPVGKLLPDDGSGLLSSGD